ncbi:MAG TPA: WD40 repeat domain-containing protein [Candidatus Angelobacter sp.]|nr:WD40 repeat domain-containing protein [Candidatus Angelobacter sp.]
MNAILRCFAGLLLLVVLFARGFASCAGIQQTDIVGYALSPDGTRIAALAEDGALFWWDVAGGKRIQLLDCVPQSEPFGHPLLFSPDSTRLAVPVNDTIQIFDLASGNVVARLVNPEQKKFETIVFSGDGRRLAANDFDNATVWDVAAQTVIASITQRMEGHTLALNHEGTLLATSETGGITLRDVRSNAIRRQIKLPEEQEAERLLFVHEDEWIAAQTAQTLPVESPKQHFYKYRREVGVWKIADGEKLPFFHGDTDELEYSLTLVQSHLLAATDYKDHLRLWNLETGALESSWDTPAGHLSADGKFLLRPGGAPGRLELWEIGSRDEKIRTFVYRSPNCAESLASGTSDNEPKFTNLFIADGESEEGAHIGSYSALGYAAPDCSRLNYSRSSYSSPERAQQELERRKAFAKKILETGPPKGIWQQALMGPRVVAEFSTRPSWPVVYGVMWVEGNSYYEISSISLDAVLALEKQFLDEAAKKHSAK